MTTVWWRDLVHTCRQAPLRHTRASDRDSNTVLPWTPPTSLPLTCSQPHWGAVAGLTRPGLPAQWAERRGEDPNQFQRRLTDCDQYSDAATIFLLDAQRVIKAGTRLNRYNVYIWEVTRESLWFAIKWSLKQIQVAFRKSPWLAHREIQEVRPWLARLNVGAEATRSGPYDSCTTTVTLTKSSRRDSYLCFIWKNLDITKEIL